MESKIVNQKKQWANRPSSKSKKKVKNNFTATQKNGSITNSMPAEKKKKQLNRFPGMSEEEVIQKSLPDHLAPDLDIVIVGGSAGLTAAYTGHYYASNGNHFWKCMYMSGLIPLPLGCYDDFKLKEYGIGFTNLCTRTTRCIADLTRLEIREGAAILKEKLNIYKPKIAVFNGKGMYDIFYGKLKKCFKFGRQPGFIEGTETIAYVMPSSSGRCALFPRAADKLPFFTALRKLRDHLRGLLPNLDNSEITFSPKKGLKRKNESEIYLSISDEESGEDRKDVTKLSVMPEPSVLETQPALRNSLEVLNNLKNCKLKPPSEIKQEEDSDPDEVDCISDAYLMQMHYKKQMEQQQQYLMDSVKYTLITSSPSVRGGQPMSALALTFQDPAMGESFATIPSFVNLPSIDPRSFMYLPVNQL